MLAFKLDLDLTSVEGTEQINSFKLLPIFSSFSSLKWFQKLVIVITFYSPSCLGQETAKAPFGLRVKLTPPLFTSYHTR